MGQQVGPTTIAFGGVVTKGSPLNRPQDSSIRCRNFRLVPGATNRSPYLRLRGGRKIQLADTVNTYNGLFEWSGQSIGVRNIGLRQVIATGAFSWVNLSITGAYSATVVAPAGSLATTASPALVKSKIFLPTNVYGRAAASVPPLRSWDGTVVRNVGIDAFLSGGIPVASFAAGAGNNVIITSVDIWVAIYNSATTHISNAVFAGRLSTPGSGTITVATLTTLTTTYNNATEQGELKYVFFASIDGAETAYLVLNSALTGPYTVSIATASTTLSITSATPQGFYTDLTQERPIENYPPRPMNNIVYAGGRVYGIPAVTSGGTKTFLKGPNGRVYADFSYTSDKPIMGAVVWSASAADIQARDFTGVPEESWPLRNIKYTPNGEDPTKIDLIPGTSIVLVLTKNSTYLLAESADGLHQWTTVSDTDGMSLDQIFSYSRTSRGPVWLSQHGQLLLLEKVGQTIRVLSDDFSDLLIGLNPSAADYIRDQRNNIEYYELWSSGTGGRSVVYDFAAGGVAWEKTTDPAASVVTARTMRDSNGNLHHIYSAAGAGLFSQEADPLTGLISTRDEYSAGVYTDPVGDYISQWIDFGDHRDKKDLTDFDVVGDGEGSDVLTTAAGGFSRPLVATFYVDLSADENTLDLIKSGQSSKNQDHNYKGRRVSAKVFWVKFRVQLTGHSGDGTLTYTLTTATDAEIPPSMYGCVYEMAVTCPMSSNRP